MIIIIIFLSCCVQWISFHNVDTDALAMLCTMRILLYCVHNAVFYHTILCTMRFVPYCVHWSSYHTVYNKILSILCTMWFFSHYVQWGSFHTVYNVVLAILWIIRFLLYFLAPWWMTGYVPEPLLEGKSCRTLWPVILTQEQLFDTFVILAA